MTHGQFYEGANVRTQRQTQNSSNHWDHCHRTISSSFFFAAKVRTSQRENEHRYYTLIQVAGNGENFLKYLSLNSKKQILCFSFFLSLSYIYIYIYIYIYVCVCVCVF